jgi:hypothetical protein
MYKMRHSPGQTGQSILASQNPLLREPPDSLTPDSALVLPFMNRDRRHCLQGEGLVPNSMMKIWGKMMPYFERRY